MTRILIVYHSQTGNTEKMAGAVARRESTEWFTVYSSRVTVKEAVIR
ncbi:MAG: hypothetical protein U9N37_06555 [Thermodesulfobacteriota bacterium]|nr:hypothetical protein [Thermodesulfobacteriota bacterium]